MSLVEGYSQCSRRVLLLVTGLNPQVVTETVYALVHQETPFIPTEVHIITTSEGAHRASLQLLGADKRWFQRLCDDYIENSVKFDQSCIHTIPDSQGKALEDIRDIEANQSTADFISKFVQEITSDERSALHASIAGGRKTMGFYLGYSLSLFGREQDRLSHVLVSPLYENHHDFYYPEKESRVIFVNDKTTTPLDTSKAKIELADIPFVRLRSFVPREQIQRKAGFDHAVLATEGVIKNLKLKVSCPSRRVDYGQHCFILSPISFAFYVWFLERHLGDKPEISPLKLNSIDLRDEFLKVYGRIVGQHSGHYETVAKSLDKEGITSSYLYEKISTLRREIREGLMSSSHEKSMTIHSQKKQGISAYVITLAKHLIEIEY